jgi:hypothetical protein
MDWAPVMGPEKYGIATDGPAVNTTTELSSVVAPSARATSTAFGLVAAFTFGLMAFSTSVRVGKTSASFNVGEA